MRLKTWKGLVPSSVLSVGFVFREADRKSSRGADHTTAAGWVKSAPTWTRRPLPGISPRAVCGPPAPALHAESMKRLGPGAHSCLQADRGGLCGGGWGPGPTPQ